jgi:hypothetical protein
MMTFLIVFMVANLLVGYVAGFSSCWHREQRRRELERLLGKYTNKGDPEK